jgi:hypothetical protein
MNPNPNNIPAFPYAFENEDAGGISLGMSLKDYFAAAAMQGMLANPEGNRQIGPTDWADLAYEQAEAMLAEREKRMNK